MECGEFYEREVSLMMHWVMRVDRDVVWVEGKGGFWEQGKGIEYCPRCCL